MTLVVDVVVGVQDNLDLPGLMRNFFIRPDFPSLVFSGEIVKGQRTLYHSNVASNNNAQCFLTTVPASQLARSSSSLTISSIAGVK